MNENVDDDDDGEIIVDRRDLISEPNHPSTASGSILLGLNQFNIGVYDDSNKLSKEKSIILVVTCISIVCNSSILYLFLFFEYNFFERVCLLVYWDQHFHFCLKICL